ncbi:GNAT family N-acetyltransferase [Thalassospira lucentensis]|nr:N-acetyltransferase [Thalassospira lucentensis]
MSHSLEVCHPMHIREAAPRDKDAILAIVEPILRAGDTYAIDPNLTRDQIANYWLGADKTTLVAEQDGQILGTYYIRTNQAGGGAHVCNCGYMVAPNASGQGLARKMCEDSLVRAKDLGYRAMQFNFVIASNAAAIHLWPKLGFEVVGRLPDAFMHPTLGETDALVMYRKL